MKALIILLVIGSMVWFAYSKFQGIHKRQRVVEVEAAHARPAPATIPKREAEAAEFKCDGRTHCSQMTSCAEATFFLRNCPGTKLDGDNNGIPCERQWCN